jgi:serine/threonine protein kinase
VHRDLKPANILLQEVLSQSRKAAKEESKEKENVRSSYFSSLSSFAALRLCERSSFIPRISDFGLAKQFDDLGAAPSVSGSLVGTPEYMAPEQAAGAPDVGPPADIFALGVILYEMLTDGSAFETNWELAFSPDGRRLAAVSRVHVQLWDVITGQMVLVLRGAPPRPHDNGFNPCVAWSLDGRFLAASNWNRSVSVWDAAERQTPAAKQTLHQAAETREPIK